MDPAQHPSVDGLETATRDAYAWFGLAYYFSECVHKSLCGMYAFGQVHDLRDVTRSRVEQRLKRAFSLPLGRLAEMVSSNLPSELREELTELITARNYLAHYFWFERAEMLCTEDGLRAVRSELEELASRFRDFDDRLTETDRPQAERLLGTDLLEQSLRRLLEGQPWTPLPNQRFPKKVERLVRAWSVPLEEKGATIILMSDDGALWQIDLEGLTWGSFATPQEGWQEHPQIQRWLPADVTVSPRLLESGAAE